MWWYRAVNNPVARRKWLTLSLTLLAVGSAYTAYRVMRGEDPIKCLLIFSLFVLMLFLYTLIALGKPRYYYYADGEIIYKPLKVSLSDVMGYDVDREGKVIRLRVKGLSPLKVRTLYFENLEDLERIERILRELLKTH